MMPEAMQRESLRASEEAIYVEINLMFAEY